MLPNSTVTIEIDGQPVWRRFHHEGRCGGHMSPQSSADVVSILEEALDQAKSELNSVNRRARPQL